MGFELPYYFTADAGGEFGFTVEVINEVFIGLENGKAGVNFKEPVINTGSELSGSVSAALQVGASAQLREFTAGLCVLFVCTGPRIGVQQDFQLGFDLLGGASLAHGTGDSCINGPVQLATTFTDWDYSAADKERCHLRSDGSFLLGGYMQIPTPKMSVVMTTSLGVDGPGSEDPWPDFEVQDKIDDALGGSNPEFMFIGPLFSPVCEGKSGVRLATCDESAAAVSSSLGSDQCMPTSMQVSTDVKPLDNLDLVAVANEFFAPNPPPPSPPPPPPFKRKKSKKKRSKRKRSKRKRKRKRWG